MKVPGLNPNGQYFLQSKFNEDLVDDINLLIEEFKPELLVLHPTGKTDQPHYHMYYFSKHKDQEARNKRVKKFFKSGYGISIPQKWGYTKEMTDISGTWFQYAVRFGVDSIKVNTYSQDFTAEKLKLSYKKSTDSATTASWDLSGNVTFIINPELKKAPKKIRKKLWTTVYELVDEEAEDVNNVTPRDVAKALFKAIEQTNSLIPRADIAKQIVHTVYYHTLNPTDKIDFQDKLISTWTKWN